MTGELYLGIDGGGTHCRARLSDAAGRTLGEGQAGASNLTLGIETAAAAIKAAADAAFGAAGIALSRQSETKAGLGLAGANVPSLAAAIRAASLPFASVEVASDAVAGCLGAHAGEDGAIVIVGTGSQGLAIVEGRMTAIGGWGFAISDEASGAVLGRAALRAAVLSVDGLAEASPLTQTIMARFAGEAAEAAIFAKNAAPRDFAALAPLVFSAHGDHDPIARALIAEALAQLETMIARLGSLGAQRIALMGGLAPAYRGLVREGSAWSIVEPKGDALYGALLMARRGAPV